MCPCGLNATYTVQSCCPPSYTETTGEQAACLHGATSAFDHEDYLDRQTDKPGHTKTDRTAIYGIYSDQKVDWTPHEDATRQATKANYLLQLSSEHRKRGRPRLQFKDTIKRNLKLRDIKTDSWTALSQQRHTWK